MTQCGFSLIIKGRFFTAGDFVTENLKNALSHLKRNGSTLVLTKDDTVFSSTVRGVLPLLTLIDDNELNFSEFSAADKVVGRGAALLYAYMNIKEIYATVMSEKAKEIFDLYKIPCYYDTLVPYIINRKGDGMCPVEKATENITDVNMAYDIIKTALNKLNN